MAKVRTELRTGTSIINTNGMTSSASFSFLATSKDGGGGFSIVGMTSPTKKLCDMIKTHKSISMMKRPSMFAHYWQISWLWARLPFLLWPSLKLDLMALIGLYTSSNVSLWLCSTVWCECVLIFHVHDISAAQGRPWKIHHTIIRLIG